MFIFDYKCVDSCPFVAEYINIINVQKFCVKNCNSISLYNILSSKQCTNNCKNISKYLIKNNCFDRCIYEFPYKYEGENENSCHKNCSEIGLLTNIVTDTCVSNCKNLGAIRYNNICVSSCPYNAIYTYSTSDENYCLKSCILYGQASNGITCDEDFCTMNCEEYGLIVNYQTNMCENSDLVCQNGKFKNYLNKSCVENCPDEIIFIKDNYLVKKCEKLYYEDNNGNKICINNCSGDYPFLIINQKKCVSSFNSINNYQLNGFNICYSQCNEQAVIQRLAIITKNIFSNSFQICINNDNTKTENDCVTECLRPF